MSLSKILYECLESIFYIGCITLGTHMVLNIPKYYDIFNMYYYSNNKKPSSSNDMEE